MRLRDHSHFQEQQQERSVTRQSSLCCRSVYQTAYRHYPLAIPYSSTWCVAIGFESWILNQQRTIPPRSQLATGRVELLWTNPLLPEMVPHLSTARIQRCSLPTNPTSQRHLPLAPSKATRMIIRARIHLSSSRRTPSSRLDMGLGPSRRRIFSSTKK